MNRRTDIQWTHIQKAFYNLPTTAFGRRQEIEKKNPDKCIDLHNLLGGSDNNILGQLKKNKG